MPRRELSRPDQITDWLASWGQQLSAPAEMILIGSGGILWHAHRAGVTAELSEQSMDVDPVTLSDAVAELAYDAMIGSRFEEENGWHVNLLPHMVLDHLPEGWKDRCSHATYGNLGVTVPCVADLLAPKMARNEPRDQAHYAYAEAHGLLDPQV